MQVSRRASPWLLSIALHGALILIGLSLTWTIIRLEDRPPAPVVEAGLPAPSMPAILELTPLEAPGPRAAPDPPAPEPEPIPQSQPREAAPPLEAPTAPVVPTHLATSFAGSDLPGGDLVFVLDASGTMIPWFHAVVDELDRSISAMRPEHRFAVVLFKGSEAVIVPPGRMRPATDAERSAAVRWLRDTPRWGGPGLGSDPVAALKHALQLDPATIVLFSGGMDASTSFSLDAAGVLKALAAAADDATNANGHGAVIRCVQLVPNATIEPDPLLSAIAEAHGGGAVHLITPEELDP